jgi:hypothetical protein
LHKLEKNFKSLKKKPPSGVCTAETPEVLAQTGEKFSILKIQTPEGGFYCREKKKREPPGIRHSKKNARLRDMMPCTVRAALGLGLRAPNARKKKS